MNAETQQEAGHVAGVGGRRTAAVVAASSMIAWLTSLSNPCRGTSVYRRSCPVRYRPVPHVRKGRKATRGSRCDDAAPADWGGRSAAVLDGLAASIAERGYRETTVADIVRHARTSKRTFYEQFASKEECLIELLRTNNDRPDRHHPGGGGPRSRLAAADPRRPSDAYVDHIDARPAITLSWIREAPALGLAARPLHRLAMEQLTEMLVTSPTARASGAQGLTPAPRAAGAHPARRIARTHSAFRRGRNATCTA